MLEIFDKAREYARLGMDRDEHRVLAAKLKKEGKVGEWRLHQQAFKIFRIAQNHCADLRLQEPQKQSEQPMSIGEVVEEINCMQSKYGMGWSHEGQWYIKDYRSPEDLMSTLAFLRQMDVKFKRKDENDISQSVHLRLSEEDFDLIFNPVADAGKDQTGRQQRRGRA